MKGSSIFTKFHVLSGLWRYPQYIYGWIQIIGILKLQSTLTTNWTDPALWRYVTFQTFQTDLPRITTIPKLLRLAPDFSHRQQTIRPFGISDGNSLIQYGIGTYGFGTFWTQNWLLEGFWIGLLIKWLIGFPVEVKQTYIIILGFSFSFIPSSTVVFRYSSGFIYIKVFIFLSVYLSVQESNIFFLRSPFDFPLFWGFNRALQNIWRPIRLKPAPQTKTNVGLLYFLSVPFAVAMR